MKTFKLIAVISGAIGVIIMLLGVIALIFKIQILGIVHVVNMFHVANSFLLAAIGCLLYKPGDKA